MRYVAGSFTPPASTLSAEQYDRAVAEIGTELDRIGDHLDQGRLVVAYRYGLQAMFDADQSDVGRRWLASARAAFTQWQDRR